MRRIFLWGLLAIALEGYGAPAAETAGQSIVLRNAGAEYDFRNGEFHLISSPGPESSSPGTPTSAASPIVSI